MKILPDSGMQFFATKVEIWLDVVTTEEETGFEGGDIDTYSVVAVTTNWAQNTIPTCEILLPVGVSISFGGSSEPRELPNPTPGGGDSAFRRARVQIRLEGDGMPSGKWPGNAVTLFDGLLISRGHANTSDKTGVTYQLIHWLAQLDYGSALSGATHPGGATSATFRAVFGNASGLSRPSFISDNFPDAMLLDPQNIVTDVWSKAIQPLFVQLTAENVVGVSEVDSLCNEQMASGNAEAAEALGRMDGTSEFSIPLALAGVDSQGILSGNILQWIQGRMNETLVNATLWEKLIGELAPGLMFTVVPRVEDALIVPQQFACREVWQEVLYDDTFDMQDFRSSRRPLRGVLVFSQYTDQSGFTAEETAVPGACFLPEQANRGLVLHTVAPAWMSGLAVSLARPSETAFRRQGVGSATSLPQPVDEEAVEAREDAAELETDYYRRYAEWVYYAEAVRSSHARLTGPLRFDICPASTIRLIHSDIATQRRQTLEPIVGYVIGLSHHINAETLTAATTFELSHMRTDAENDSSRYASDTHAIYGKLFAGAPLIDELRLNPLHPFQDE